MNESPKTTPGTDPKAMPNQPAENVASAAQKVAGNDTPSAGIRAEGQVHALTPEIRKQWSKFTDGDLAGVKGRDDLTAKVEMKYAISHDEAKKQVQAWAQGRQF